MGLSCVKNVFGRILLYANYNIVDLKWLIKTPTITLGSGVLSKPSGPMTWIYSSNTSVCWSHTHKKYVLLIFGIVWMGEREQRIPL